MPDASDYFRGYARDVGLSPVVNGANNVQDALAAGGSGVTLGNFSTDVVSQDTPTALPADGAGHVVTCLIAAPPAWMDNAGNIIAEGLYEVGFSYYATNPPTTPAQYARYSSPFFVTAYAPLDALGASGGIQFVDIQALAVADVPYAISTQVTMPTDASATATGAFTVIRLAH